MDQQLEAQTKSCFHECFYNPAIHTLKASLNFVVPLMACLRLLEEQRILIGSLRNNNSIDTHRYVYTTKDHSRQSVWNADELHNKTHDNGSKVLFTILASETFVQGKHTGRLLLDSKTVFHASNPLFHYIRRYRPPKFVRLTRRKSRADQHLSLDEIRRGSSEAGHKTGTSYLVIQRSWQRGLAEISYARG